MKVGNTIFFTAKLKNLFDSFPQELKILWSETASSIPNAYMALQDMEGYKNSTGRDMSKTHYAFTQLVPAPRGTVTSDGIVEKDFFAMIVVTNSPNTTDIAHEITHYYLHGQLGYPYVWDTSDGNIDSLELQYIRSITQRMYDISVHPTIDKILFDRGLLFNGFYDRMYNDYKNLLKKTTVSILEEPLRKYDLLSRFIEYQNRLPEKYLNKIFAKFNNTEVYKKFIKEAQDFPLYSVKTFEPETVSDFVLSAWRYMEINLDNAQLDLVEKSPLLFS